MNKGKENFFWVDYIRVTAIGMVILLHTVAPLLYDYGRISNASWWLANTIDSSVRMCVPLFFMLTGFLLLGKQESIGTHIKKRLSRILIPLLTWSFIYLLWVLLYKRVEMSPLMVLNRLYSGMYYHFWFLYALIGLYLIIPILRIFLANAKEKEQHYFIGLWFIATALIPLMEKISLMLFNRELSSQLDLQMMMGYSGYLLLGFLLGKWRGTKQQAWLAFGAYLLSVIITASATHFETNHYGHFVGGFYSYQSLNVMIMAVSAFVLLKYFAENCKHPPFIIKLVTTISPLTLGIYLAHPMFLELFSHESLPSTFQLTYPTMIYLAPVKAILAGLLSFVLIFVFSKLPLFKRTV